MVISISGKPGTDYWPYLKMCDERLFAQGGRPHWGKLHFMTGERLATLFEKYDAFKTIRRKFDPAGMFLNDHLAVPGSGVGRVFPIWHSARNLYAFCICAPLFGEESPGDGEQ